jgi:aminoglycoside 2'-N-acetyltransferase I
VSEAHELLDEIFADGFDDQDWDHCLGGLHTLAWDHDRLIGHASVVQRRLIHQGRALRCGYVEGVGVTASWRHKGVGAALMAPLEGVIGRAYDVGALGATEDGAPFYAGRGWQVWQGSAWALTPSGRLRTPDEEGWIYVLPGAAPLDLAGELTCDWRDGDVW